MRSTYHLSVMERFMSKEDLEAFNKVYSRNLSRRGKGEYFPTELDIMIAKEWQSKKITKEQAAKRMGVATPTFMYRVALMLQDSKLV